MSETNTQMNKANRTPEPWEIDRGGPAFPVSQDCAGPESAGMDLRDYFAAKAMQGLVANSAVIGPNPASGWAMVNTNTAGLAGFAYDIADAMLAARPAK